MPRRKDLLVKVEREIRDEARRLNRVADELRKLRAVKKPEKRASS